ncbi:hypothetical protein NQ176_g8657 [Zarea fungicola]|uniref:Uncharacterized protein n=1 Tax=Zarea fungicola TaxID=93591 RepID=A0ACC1MRW3_9HYPO|nr:hypothetical protein NQ176_g8657 [Lecanicillium fungicola]
MTTDLSSPALAGDLRSRDHDRHAPIRVNSSTALKAAASIAVDDDTSESLSPIISRRPTSKHSRSTGPPLTKENQPKNPLRPTTSNQGNTGLDPLSTVCVTSGRNQSTHSSSPIRIY